MLSIIFLLIIGVIVLAYLLLQQQKKVDTLKETLADLKEVQEVKEIKSNLKGRDQERERIAKDWHDGIGNSLSTLRFIVDTIQPKNQKSHTEALSILEHTQREFRQIIDDELINGFSNELTMMRTFEQWQRQFQLGKVKMTYEVNDFIEYSICPIILKTHLYRITQELLTNTIKHAQATEVRVVLKEEERNLELQVEDNGVGWNQGRQTKNGLRSVKDRLKILGGTIQIDTTENIGTKVNISIPLRNSEK